MLWDSDIYMGRLVDALKQKVVSFKLPSLTFGKGMWDNTLFVYSADNGGVGQGISIGVFELSKPSTTIDYPKRGEKHSNWNGGMRVAAFVSGGLVPDELRGTSSDLICHVVDWCQRSCVSLKQTCLGIQHLQILPEWNHPMILLCHLCLSTCPTQ